MTLLVAPATHSCRHAALETHTDSQINIRYSPKRCVDRDRPAAKLA